MLVRILAAAFALVTVASPATAQRIRPDVNPIRDGSAPPTIVGPHSSLAAICAIGPPGQNVNKIDWVLPPQDHYYSFLSQSTCTACGPGTSVSLGAAHVVLSFPATPCSVRADISVVQALGPQGCALPTDATICPVRSVTLVAPPNGGIVEFSVPLGSCAFTGRAFLKVTFQQFSGSCAAAGLRPQLFTSGSCLPCLSYNSHQTYQGDLCTAAPGFPGNPRMWVDVTACGVLDATDVGPRPELSLEPAYPNPARGDVTIGFALPRGGESTLRVIDLAGAVVKTLVEGYLEEGPHVAVWDRTRDRGGLVAPGLYFYELRTGGIRQARRIVVIE